MLEILKFKAKENNSEDLQGLGIVSFYYNTGDVKMVK